MWVLALQRCAAITESVIKDILLAEDDPLDAELTLTVLRDGNLDERVVVVQDGEQALDYLYCRGVYKNRVRINPILVLLDLKMPKVDGLEVLQAIRNEESLRTIPVVALTSSREVTDLANFYKQGGCAYVVKPVDFAEFKKVVKEIGTFWATVNEPPPR